MNNEISTLEQRIRNVTGQAIPKNLRVFDDLTDYSRIDVGHVLHLGENDYLVRGHAREGRFGIDDQPKLWVKSAVDLQTGERKFIKMVFLETFTCRIGSMAFDCVRSPEKEADVLLKMRGHPHFMQGVSVPDVSGNLVRILDVVPGISCYEYLRRLDIPHEEYYHHRLNEVMAPVIEAIAAISELHDLGLNHGDIRADHLFVQKGNAPFVWIDFDYDIKSQVYDAYCLGNILLQTVGKGRHSLHDIRLAPSNYPDLKESLDAGDMSLMFRHRVANLRKLFPYISADLNDFLMRFSTRSINPSLSVKDLKTDLLSLFPVA
ncbi:lipopolysaccharide kinase InaA family protein [bacterium]|nr:lipopolysaccharide kinase InaA family protein [bacterium]